MFAWPERRRQNIAAAAAGCKDPAYYAYSIGIGKYTRKYTR